MCVVGFGYEDRVHDCFVRYPQFTGYQCTPINLNINFLSMFSHM